ncbi:MAG TPA: dihydrodipicolinate synthase family protein [Chitinophagaceae bacterium]|jgi:4-hydroxy-tetrahydrodipicolinate synthase
MRDTPDNFGTKKDMVVEWKGVFPALTTKFTANDELDIPLFERHLEVQQAAGIDGIIIGGSLGEASTLTTTEKERLVKTAGANLKQKIPVILNIAESSTTEALKQVAYAKAWGADGLMVLPPMRYKTDDRETIAWFTTIARSTDLPVMIYNNPVDYKTDVTPDILEELLECKNIAAVKDSTRDISNVTRLVNRFGGRLKIFCGVDTIAMEELCMGADGWVGGLVCAFPAETVAIYRLVKAGRIAEARAIQRWFLPLLELDLDPKLVQYIKLAEMQVGLGSEHVRAPRLALAGKERESILELINRGISTRPALPDFLSVNI